jgi:Fur family transcriptional regulator, ferric uptake regulator
MSNAEKDLKLAGLKSTLPRMQVLDLIRASDQRHLSAEDIYRKLISQDADVGLATVYRVLAQLEQAGILSRNTFDNNKAVFELNGGEHHDHLICVTCGTVTEFSSPEIEARQEEVARRLGFMLSDHRLALYGQCSGCVQQKSAGARRVSVKS